MQTLPGIHNPLNLPTLDASGYVTGQLYLDETHAAEIAASMRARGWQGAPLVVLPDYGISYSGTHRLSAAEDAGLEEVPAVRLHDLFEAAGLDLDAICDEHDLGLTTDRPEILDHLPDHLREAYGLADIC
ncbi:ParB N-terminal domain-containing protein [Streptomyces sp. NPDC000927]|uniref:ParB N-terminal domain-containing protein n=1 Tax=Streptomyces sp. NPDC000927 TaxID=3154371 RepID=UPI00332E439E